MLKSYFSIFIYLLIPFFSLSEIKEVSPTPFENNNFEKEVLAEKVAMENILDELCKASGMDYSNNRQPNIEIKKGDFIAYFDPLYLNICVSESVVKFALEQKSEPRKHIYLQVIGHELGHYIIALQKKRKGNSSHLIDSEEKEADILGIFVAMLAGHTEIKKDVPWILDSLYHRFNLVKRMKKNPQGYLPIKERRQIADYAIKRASHFHKLFQFANYLTAAEKYAPAILIYDHLLGFYDSPEFYNNRGILNLLQGIQDNYSSDNRYQRFFFPIEFELDSKLSQVRNDGKKLEEIDDTLFLEAISDFDSAIRLNKTKEGYSFNLAVAHILMTKYGDAEDVLLEHCPSDGHMEELFRAIILASKGEGENDTLAMQKFKELEEEEQGEIIGQLAHLNYLVLSGDVPLPAISEKKCPENLGIEINDLLTFDTIHCESIKEDSPFQFGWNENYFVFRENGTIRLTLQILPKSFSHIPLKDYMLSEKGLNFSIYACKDSYGELRIIHLGDGNGALMMTYGR